MTKGDFVYSIVPLSAPSGNWPRCYVNRDPLSNDDGDGNENATKI